MSQSQPLRIENPDFASLMTSRAIQSRLWFVNNRLLEQRMLGYLAKYQEKYDVELYGFVFQGNHFHTVAQFPNCNRAAFGRDFNARTVEAVRALVPRFGGGPLFERRYSEQALPRPEDIEKYVLYAALQPVLNGITEYPSEYPGYNSFIHAISGYEEKYKVVDWAKYNDAKRYNKYVNVKDYTKTYTLTYSRIPGYEDMTQKEYKKMMLQKLEAKRVEKVAELKAAGHVFLTKRDLKKVKPGSLPRTTKKSSRNDPRPLVLTDCQETKRCFLEWYFGIYEWYKSAVERYLKGDLLVEFPPGTYRPPGPFVPIESS